MFQILIHQVLFFFFRLKNPILSNIKINNINNKFSKIIDKIITHVAICSVTNEPKNIVTTLSDLSDLCPIF